MDQLNLFTSGQEHFKIKNKVRLIELFAGIGSQAKALERLGVDFEPYVVCEFDEKAIQSYNAIHGTNFPTSDITKLKGSDLFITETDKYTYILTYSFPCQDLSLAGKQRGMKKGSNTRSSLLFEVERLLNECMDLNGNLPQVLLMENVPQVHSEQNREDFRNWIGFLESIGYNCFYQDLNAKDYGIPQNRDRTFMVSILGNYTYTFPDAFELKLRLKDMLEDNVDEKYYISEKSFLSIDQKNPKCVIVREATKKGYTEAYEGDSINFEQPNSETRRGRVGKQIAQTLNTSYFQAVVEPICLNSKGGRNGIEGLQPSLQNRIYDSNGIATSVTTGFMPKYTDKLQIRKLTPRECWKLMGFDDNDFEKASQVNSNCFLYKQAGNSIVVDVLYYIFKQMI